MLKTRIYTVLVLLPLFVAALFYLPVVLWALFLVPLMLVGAWEWGVLAGWRVQGRIAYVLAMAILGIVLWYFGYQKEHRVGWLSPTIFGIALLFWLVVAPLWLAKAWQVRASLMLAITGALVLIPLWWALILLKAQPMQLLVLMAIVWISDTAAYLCGRRWGRRKLAVTISPGKTWEGVWGALLAVSLYYALVSGAGLTEHAVLQGVSGFAVFVLLAVLGIEGDLFESWIKRTAGMKDSGTIFPGHGGVLDRIDALSSSVPVAALVLVGIA